MPIAKVAELLVSRSFPLQCGTMNVFFVDNIDEVSLCTFVYIHAEVLVNAFYIIKFDFFQIKYTSVDCKYFNWRYFSSSLPFSSVSIALCMRFGRNKSFLFQIRVVLFYIVIQISREQKQKLNKNSSQNYST